MLVHMYGLVTTIVHHQSISISILMKKENRICLDKQLSKEQVINYSIRIVSYHVVDLNHDLSFDISEIHKAV